MSVANPRRILCTTNNIGRPSDGTIIIGQNDSKSTERVAPAAPHVVVAACPQRVRASRCNQSSLNLKSHATPSESHLSGVGVAQRVGGWAKTGGAARFLAGPTKNVEVKRRRPFGERLAIAGHVVAGSACLDSRPTLACLLPLTQSVEYAELYTQTRESESSDFHSYPSLKRFAGDESRWCGQTA